VLIGAFTTGLPIIRCSSLDLCDVASNVAGRTASQTADVVHKGFAGRGIYRD